MRATVAVTRGLGGPDVAKFDIRSVRLVYDIGTIHRVAGVTASRKSLRSALRRSLDRGGDRTIADIAEGGRLPFLTRAPADPVAPDQEGAPEPVHEPGPDAVDHAGPSERPSPKPASWPEEAPATPPAGDDIQEPQPTTDPAQDSPLEAGPVQSAEPAG